MVVDVTHDIRSKLDYVLVHRILDDVGVIEQQYRFEWHPLLIISKKVCQEKTIEEIYQKHWHVFVRVLPTNFDLEFVHRVLLYRPRSTRNLNFERIITNDTNGYLSIFGIEYSSLSFFFCSTTSFDCCLLFQIKWNIKFIHTKKSSMPNSSNF